MNIKGQGNAIQVFWLALGYFTSFAVGIGSAMILSRYFDKAEYGTYRQIIYVYNTLLVIFSVGLPKVYAYFLPKYNKEEGRYIVNKITRLLLLFGFLFSISLYFGSDYISNILKNKELSYGLKLFSPIPFLMLPTLGIEGIYSTYKKTLTIAIYNITTRLLMLFFIVLPVVVFEGTYIYAIYGWLAVSVISFIIALILKNKPFRNLQTVKPNFTYKSILNYSTPIVVASLAGVAIQSSNQFFISRYFGEVEFANFSNGFIQLPFVVMVTSSVATVLMPQISKLHTTNPEKIGVLYKSAIINSAIVLYPLISFFLVFSSDIVEILFTSSYLDSSNYMKLSMVFNYFNILVFAPIFLGMGASKAYSKIHIITAIFLWILSYGVVFVVPNPYLVAVVFVFMRVVLIAMAYKVILQLLKVKLTDILPFKIFFKLIIHTLMCSLIIYYTTLFLGLDALYNVLLAFVLYILLLLVTDLLIKNTYLEKYKGYVNKITK